MLQSLRGILALGHARGVPDSGVAFAGGSGPVQAPTAGAV